MIVEKLKSLDLKILEFAKFCNINKNKLNHILRTQDPIYMKGLELKLKEFLHYKITQLQQALNK
jgi:predicted transcriptional regulator